MVEAVSATILNQPMFNLTVDTAHTFFVGEGQWLVHNDICDTDVKQIEGTHVTRGTYSGSKFEIKQQGEIDFANAMLSKTNYQVYRTADGGDFGDFIVVDWSTGNPPTYAWVVEVKDPGSTKTRPYIMEGSSKNQIKINRLGEVLDYLEMPKNSTIRALEGTPDMLITYMKDGSGRGSFPSP